MMEIVQFLWAILQVLGAIIMWVSVGLFLVKTMWNFGVPYAMIHEALKQPKNRHSWSLFILLDLGCLVLALVASTLAGQYAIMSTWTIAIYGIGAIVASYVHLVTILLVGVLFGLFPKNSQGIEKDLGCQEPFQ